MSLTDKQARFVEEYLVDLNATQAAIRAGYSENSADVIGCENLGKPKIATAIQAAMEERSQRTEIDQDRVLRELARIGFADIRDLFEWDEERTAFVPSRDLTEDEAAAISEVRSETTHSYDRDGDRSETSIKLKLKTYDKLSALEKIGKHLGMFVDRVQHSGPDGGPIQVEDMSDEQLETKARQLTNRIAPFVSAGTHSTNGKSANGNGAHP